MVLVVVQLLAGGVQRADTGGERWLRVGVLEELWCEREPVEEVVVVRGGGGREEGAEGGRGRF